MDSGVDCGLKSEVEAGCRGGGGNKPVKTDEEEREDKGVPKKKKSLQNRVLLQTE